MQFYSQGVRGQLEILKKSRPNAEVISSPAATRKLKDKLILAEELCDFASKYLALPGDTAYHRYADLGRDHVVYVIHAAPEFSMEPKTWKYPVIGELDYRGYFKKSTAEAYAEQLEAEGYDVHLGGTDAYSTLGMFHDPLLNTFITYPEIDFAETIFHELTHRRIFKNGDTTFNESLATAVAEEGVRRYLKFRNRRDDLADYEERLKRRAEFFDEIARTREELKKLYASGDTEPEKRRKKRMVLAELKARADSLQKRWGGKQLAEWIKLDLTNAHLLALITYNSEIPKFRRLLDENEGDFEAFFEAVDKLK
ncbi:aminopeptidase [Luteolibacter algae]|uniref:Aminopeptidase n=1 Tax=Luteolibacter algae TaxID=454151 RepID=A0ABW5D5T9_9BACT